MTPQAGGSIFIDRFSSFLIMSGNVMKRNSVIGGRGGALSCYADSLKIIDNSLVDNAASQGGAFFLSGSDMCIRASSFHNNTASDYGGTMAIASGSDMLIDGVVVNAGSATVGAGVYVISSTSLSVTNSSFSGNIALDSGGALMCASVVNVSLHSLRVAGNAARGVGGGGIYLSSVETVSIVDFECHNNTALNEGGCMSVIAGANVSLSSAVFDGNIVRQGSGSAMYFTSLSGGFLSGSNLFKNNQAPEGGGTVFWAHNSGMLEPLGLSNSQVCQFVDNSALYGNQSATEGVAINFLHAANYEVVDYAAVYITPIEVGLFDYYGSLVAAPIDDTVQIASEANPCFDGLSYVGGALLTPPSSGIARFDSLQAFCAPGYNMTLLASLTVTSDDRGVETSMEAEMLVSFRSCRRGEYYANKVCNLCENSSYSLDENSDLSVRGCKRCPAHADTCWGDVIDVSEGYWRISELASTILPCPLGKESCKGGVVSGEASCAVGYTGGLCAVCADQYWFSSASSRCQSCSDVSSVLSPATIVVVAIVGLAVIAGGLYYRKLDAASKACNRRIDVGCLFLTDIGYLNGNSTDEDIQQAKLFCRVLFKRMLARFKIYVTMYQCIVAMPFVLDMHFPESFSRVLAPLNIVNLDIVGLVYGACDNSDIDYIDKLVTRTLYPMVVVMVLFLAREVHTRLLRRRAHISEDAINSIRDFYFFLFLVFSYMILPSISAFIFGTFR